jgi:hypothetical protein
MAKPTEPGWYWLRDGSEWTIVEVSRMLLENTLTVYFTGYGGISYVDRYDDDAWGGKITQEPAPDPPPPF